MPDCTVVKLPEEGNKVSPVKRRRIKRILGMAGPKLYVGLEDKLPRPASRERQISDKWQRIQRDDLSTYTENIATQVMHKCQMDKISTNESWFDPLLLLTGSVVDSSITLSPKIWYRCRAPWVLNIVRKETDGLNWTVDRGLGDKIESELDEGLRLAQATVRLPKQLSLQGRGIDLPRGYTVFINYQDSDKMQGACGLLCSLVAKQGDDLKYHGLCRIGGVLTIRDGGGKPQNVAVTAAHGLLDHFLTADVLLPPQPRTRRTLGRSDRWPWSIARLGRRNGHLLDLDNVTKLGTTKLIGHVDEDKTDEIKWRPVRRVHAVNWLGGGWESTGHWQFPFMAHSLERLASDSDFALFELPTEVINMYDVGKERKVVTRLLRESEMKCGPVELLLACDQVVPGTLLYDIPSLYLRGARFPTRRIQLDKPLAVGTSGSWVVQDGGLCGMVVACYTDRPFAHILTAEKLISDIKKTLGHHVEVSLPSLLPVPASSAAVPPHQELLTNPGNAVRHIPYWESDEQWYQDRDGKPSIATRLREALVRSSSDQAKYFLPLDVQRDILTRSSVEDMVRRCYSSSPALDDNTPVDDLCNYICGEEPLAEQGPDETARMILAVLILIEMPSRIVDFFYERVYNSDLPLRRVGEQGASFTLARRSNKEALKCFSGWSPLRILQFDEYQWYMIAPYFKSGPDQTPLFYDFHDRIILPFIMNWPLGEEGGRFSTIRKIKIHPAHHAFDRLKLPRGPPDIFALKRLHSRRDHALDIEMEASQMIIPHPHLLRSLCSFHLLDFDYLLLPWADGGSLFDAWRADLEVPLITSQLLRWALAQCEGLAEGLATMHDIGYKLSSLPSRPPSRVGYGVHGDIKPENVLWFSDGGHGHFSRGYGVLQLGDYGLTSFSKEPSSTTGFLPKGLTPNYSAPEIEVNNRVSRASDIWGLGCVYLEFISWLLLGWAGVREFAEMRTWESDSRRNYPNASFFKASQKPLEDKAPRAILKESVDEWIRRLEEMSGCPEHLQKFVRVIKESMLQVDFHDRYLANVIVDMLRSIQEIPISKALPDAPAEVQPTLSPPRETVPNPVWPELPPDAQVSSHDEIDTTSEGRKPVVDRSLMKKPLPPDLPGPPSSGLALQEPVTVMTTDQYVVESHRRREADAAASEGRATLTFSWIINRAELEPATRAFARVLAATNLAAAADAASNNDPDKRLAAYKAKCSSLEPKQLDFIEKELKMQLQIIEDVKE